MKEKSTSKPPKRPDRYTTDLRINATPEAVAGAIMKGGHPPRPETRRKPIKRDNGLPV